MEGGDHPSSPADVSTIMEQLHIAAGILLFLIRDHASSPLYLFIYSYHQTLVHSWLWHIFLIFIWKLDHEIIIYEMTWHDLSFITRHPFDSSKWGRICQFLITDGILDKGRIVEPLEASREDLLAVHPPFLNGPCLHLFIKERILQEPEGSGPWACQISILTFMPAFFSFRLVTNYYGYFSLNIPLSALY